MVVSTLVQVEETYKGRAAGSFVGALGTLTCDNSQLQVRDSW